jgi:hypothetical protein
MNPRKIIPVPPARIGDSLFLQETSCDYFYPTRTGTPPFFLFLWLNFDPTQMGADTFQIL